jgi:hypothetical protein
MPILVLIRWATPNASANLSGIWASVFRGPCHRVKAATTPFIDSISLSSPSSSWWSSPSPIISHPTSYNCTPSTPASTHSRANWTILCSFILYLINCRTLSFKISWHCWRSTRMSSARLSYFWASSISSSESENYFSFSRRYSFKFAVSICNLVMSSCYCSITIAYFRSFSYNHYCLLHYSPSPKHRISISSLPSLFACFQLRCSIYQFHSITTLPYPPDRSSLFGSFANSTIKTKYLTRQSLPCTRNSTSSISRSPCFSSRFPP